MDQPATAALTTAEMLAPAQPGTRVVQREALGRRLWRAYVTDVRVDAEARSAAYRAETPAGIVDRRMAIVLITVALCLTSTNFLSAGSEPGWLTAVLEFVGLDRLAHRVDAAVTTSAHREFWRLAFWTGVNITSYVALPVLVIRYVLHGHVRDFGLRVRGIARHLYLYALLFAVAFPAVFLASYGGAFQHKYPFYDLAPGEAFLPYLWAWWVLYWLQFVALEFFFRGFVIHGLAPRLGYASIFVMAVPYNMIHYGKPMPEALAAIVGGVVLGTLSLKTRSIWWGAALHISVAVSMDLLSLWHKGFVF